MKKIACTIWLVMIIGIAYSQEKITDPKATEKWSPVPVVVTPGEATQAPSDAIILLGKDTDLSLWEGRKGGEVEWDFQDGVLTVKPGSGDILTRNYFGDCQLHVEWRTPEVVKGDWQGRGNSGIFLMDRYEVQVLDSYNNRTYSNGQAASIYKQAIPLVNVCRPPGEWQTYDIIWKAPSFNKDGSLDEPAFITVIQNGVLVQNHTEIRGSTEYIGNPVYEAHPDRQPIKLQEHRNPVSYRNIWIREL